MLLSKVLTNSSDDSSEQIQNVLRAARRHLSMDVGFVSEFIEGERVFRFSDGELGRNPIAIGASDPLEQSFCHYVARGVMPQIMHDARENSVASQLSVTHELPVGAHLSVPLSHPDGTIFGTLCCFSFRPDQGLTGRDLAVLRMCADVVCAVTEKDRRTALGRSARRERIAKVITDAAVEMVFQPVYRVADDRLMAFEALARFPSEPVRGPDVWFSEASEVGLGEDLELFAVRKAFASLPQLDPSIRLAVNLSPTSILSSGFAEALKDVPLGRVVIELTEHAVVESYDALRAALSAFRAQGLRLAIDDVGAGHSTFRHVLDLSPELIKLDRSLIHGLDADLSRRALAEALTQYGRRIGCEVVAEGVETLDEYAVLREIGVTRGQGYLLGRPLSLSDAVKIPLHRSI